MSTENVLPTGLGDNDHQQEPSYAPPDPFMLKIRQGWHSIIGWLTDTTATLPVLPDYLKHWSVGYLMAIIAQLLAISLVTLIVSIYPTFTFFSLLIFAAAVLIYLVWGMAQGIFATLLGAFCLAFFVLPPRFSLQIDGQGEMIGVGLYVLLGFALGLLVSTTQRIRLAATAAQVEARAAHQQLYEILRQSPMPITVLRGPEGIIDSMHSRTQQVVGDKRVVGKPFREAFPEYGSQGIFELVDRVYRSGEPLMVQELRAETIHHGQGQQTRIERFFNVVYYPLRTPAGAIDGIVIFNVDITEQVQARKQVEQLLQERETERDRLRAAIANEQALRVVAESATRQLQTVLDVLPVGVTITDAQGGFIRRNNATLQLWGERSPTLASTAEYAHYKGWWAQTGQPVAADEWGLARALLKGETLLGEEVDIEAFDGQRKTMLHFATPILDDTGAITGAVVAQLDITTRKRLERALQQAEQIAVERANQLEAIFEAITDAVFVLSKHRDAPRLNRAARALLEMPEDQALDVDAEAPFTLLDEQGQPLPHEQWPETRLGMGESLLSENAVDVRMCLPSGRVVALSITGAPLRDAEGAVIGGVLVGRDVTERRKLEQQTQESLRTLLILAEALVSLPTSAEEQAARSQPVSPLETVAGRLAKLIRAVLDCQRVSITTIDAETGELRSVAVIGLGEELAQQWREHRPGFHLRDVLEGTPVVEQLGAGEIVFVDMRQPPFDTQPNPYGIATMLMAPMRIGTRLIGMLALDDNGSERLFSEGERALTKAVAELAALIMERERLQEERAASHASILALQEANRLKDEFIGIAGHELRTPLTTIKASVQLAKRQLARMQGLAVPLPPEVATIIPVLQNLLDRAERQVGMQNRLVSDLLDVSRIEVGQLELHPALHDLTRLVQETVEDQQALTPDRSIFFTCEASEELLILGDADRLRQVIINYLTNALKYSEPSKPVSVRIIPLEREVRVEVEDQGPGLIEVQQQRIWERFYRVPDIEVKSGSGVGLGLGLHISRTIIERHGGRVGVESTPGEGSTFWLTVPKAE